MKRPLSDSRRICRAPRIGGMIEVMDYGSRGDVAMNQITVGQSLTNQFADLTLPVEVVDEFGRLLGHFVPRAATATSDDCPYTAEELDAMRVEQGGRPLSEIWKSLGIR